MSVLAKNVEDWSQVIPFWILDFRFWIGNCFTCLDSINRSVAFFFQTGIRVELVKIKDGHFTTINNTDNV